MKVRHSLHKYLSLSCLPILQRKSFKRLLCWMMNLRTLKNFSAAWNFFEGMDKCEKMYATLVKPPKIFETVRIGGILIAQSPYWWWQNWRNCQIFDSQESLPEDLGLLTYKPVSIRWWNKIESLLTGSCLQSFEFMLETKLTRKQHVRKR